MLGQSPLWLIWLKTALPFCQLLVIHTDKLSPIECLELVRPALAWCLGALNICQNLPAFIAIKWDKRTSSRKQSEYLQVIGA